MPENNMKISNKMSTILTSKAQKIKCKRSQQNREVQNPRVTDSPTTRIAFRGHHGIQYRNLNNINPKWITVDDRVEA